VLLVMALLLTLVASSCISLPSDGPVRAKSIADNGEGETLVDYTPAGPRPGTAPGPLVDSWLTSMTATPMNTLVAREFLTAASGTSWVPERGTVVYGSQDLTTRPGGVVLLRLRDVVELDDRGAWRGDPTSGRGHDYLLRLAREDGQWRISHPPDRLLIPRAHLDSQYQQCVLFFLDRSGQVLVPEPVYVPRGRQAPTLLVAALLKGPERHLGEVQQTFFPPGTRLDGISVPVTRDGTAEVPLSDEVLGADDARLKVVFAQLAWTLAQVPGVLRLRVTVNGTQTTRWASETSPSSTRPSRGRPPPCTASGTDAWSPMTSGGAARTRSAPTGRSGCCRSHRGGSPSTCRPSTSPP
jgi:hypothetical protein